MMLEISFNAHMCFRPSENIKQCLAGTAIPEFLVESVPLAAHIIFQVHLRLMFASSSTLECPHVYDELVS